MTVHRAKGLEFPLVCVADLGKTGREDDAAAARDRRRPAWACAWPRCRRRVGRQRGDGRGSRRSRRPTDEEEERRIFYVAATRAEEHLVLSGATDLEKLQEPADLAEPMRWIWRALAPRLDEMEDAGGGGRRVRGPRGARGAAGCCVPPTWTGCCPRPTARRWRPSPSRPASRRWPRPALAAVPVPEALPVSRLSYSGLAAYRRCGYRFYLERALRLPRARRRPRARGPRRPRAEDALPAAAARRRWCTSCWRSWTSRAPAAPAGRARGRGRSRPRASRCAPDEVDDVTGLVAGFAGSALARADRRRRAGARRAAVRLHAGHRRRAQPADRRHRRRARPRGRRRAGRGLQERPARGRRARRPGRGRLRDPAAGVRAGRAALGGGRGGGGLLLPRAPGRARSPRTYEAGEAARWRPSCASSPRACRRAASSPRRARTAACAPTARAARRCAAGTRSARWPRRPNRDNLARLVARRVTLGSRMSRRDEAAFVGRRPELGFLDSLFVDDPPANVVLVHGPGGIGKSSLVRRVIQRGQEAGWTPLLVEGRDLPPVADALDDALARAHSFERPLVVLDTYERMAALGGHLRRSVLPRAPRRQHRGHRGPGRPGPGLARGRLGEPDRGARARAAEQRGLARAAGLSGRGRRRARRRAGRVGARLAAGADPGRQRRPQRSRLVSRARGRAARDGPCPDHPACRRRGR